MKKIIITLFILFLSLFVTQAFALSEKDITFPIAELGGCKNEAVCRNFCDKAENRNGVCFEFAKKYNLLTQEELKTAEKFNKASTQNGGPDWCKQSQGCNIITYCEDASHISECLNFAQDNNLLSAAELAKARKVETALKKGVNMPGNCTGKDNCLEYCTDLSHVDECVKFAVAMGMVTPEEAEATGTFVALARSGQTPGGKKSKDECIAYCKEPGHLEECLNFAQKAGFLSSQEVEMVRKVGGSGPGGCHSKGECEAYCNDTSHRDECMQFAKEHNIQVSFNGPGGCSDVDSCTKYCVEHKDDATCKQYAGQYGGSLGPGGCSDEASCKEYCMKNQSDAECQKMMGQYGGFTGPGGCKDIASCTEYCKSNYSDPECAKYGGQSGGQMGGFKGPGGCTDIASCTSYCRSNTSDSECQKYAGQYGGGSSGDQGQQQLQQ